MQDLMIQIPQNIENLQLASPELITFYRNLENRILWLDTEVDSYCLELSRNILQWNFEDRNLSKEEKKPIKLLIHSYGGDLDINNSLIDVIKLSDTPVHGYNMGVCCSAAAFIFMSCHRRMAMPKSTFLIHKGGADNISGTFDQIIAYIEDYQRKINLLAEFILEHSKINRETLESNLGTEWYIEAKSAVEYGFCDRIIENISEIFC